MKHGSYKQINVVQYFRATLETMPGGKLSGLVKATQALVIWSWDLGLAVSKCTALLSVLRRVSSPYSSLTCSVVNERTPSHPE